MNNIIPGSKKLICPACESPLSILIDKEEEGGKSWLYCGACNRSPMISHKDFNKVIQRWLDPKTQEEYPKNITYEKPVGVK